MKDLFLSGVCLFIAVVCIVIAVFCRAMSAGFQRTARASDAVVIGFTPETASSHARPLVRFKTADGMEHTIPAQNTGKAAQEATTGARVKILYTQKKGFGRDIWNIFIVTDAEHARPYRVYDVIAGILFAVALGLGLAAYAVWHG